MNYKEEKKVLYALAIGLILIAMIYYVGKELGKYIKNNEYKQASLEMTI